MKKLLILMQSLLFSTAIMPSCFIKTNQEKQINQLTEKKYSVDTIDLTGLEKYDLIAELPNLMQLLIDLQGNIESLVTSGFTLTNSEGGSFTWEETYWEDTSFLKALLTDKSYTITHAGWWASARWPYVNFLMVWFDNPDFPIEFNAIGRFNWMNLPSESWSSYWTDNLEYTFHIEVN